ncbi:MAG: PspC domain-containing protein [Bacteroidales bacterium]|nr:PspC domain-containing protein [Bacteroidales bacterium]
MKRLFLDRANRKIAGVCAGIANYLEVDVTVVRIIFLISLIAGGLGLWAYLVVWAIAPQA